MVGDDNRIVNPSADIKRQIKDGWKRHAFNQYVR